MKRIICIILNITLFCSLLVSCSSQPSNSFELSSAVAYSDLPQINLCVDLNNAESRYVRSFLERIPGFDQEFHVSFDLLSLDQTERDQQLTRIRTEIMAGKGPDVFICYVPQVEGFGDFLFRYPMKSMLNRIFLPLDDYIAQAQYMDMDKLLPVVMEAGKCRGEQMLLPLSFSLDTLLFDPAQYTLSKEIPSSWEEMIDSGDPMLTYAAAWQRYTNLLGNLADFETEELYYTEEEMLAIAQKKAAAQKKVNDNNCISGVDLESTARGYGGYRIMYDKLDDSVPVYTAIPPYNVQGGLTASVTTFAAINRNTQNPDTAFLLLDVLLSKQTQQNTELYACMDGMPTHMDLGQTSDKAKSIGGFWYMNEGNYQNYLELRDKINVVKFRTPLDDCLDKIQFRSVLENTPIEKIVHEEYATMKMMLAES